MTRYLTADEVLQLHQFLIEDFGGLEGLRDRNGLESAVARPQGGYYRDLIEEAAALFESLSQNHPFVDGNKRTAITAVGVFLSYNGHRLLIDDLTAYHWLITQYEAGTMKKPVIEQWLRDNVKQP